MLPDDVVLEIFDFCRQNHDLELHWPSEVEWKWHILAHVCRRWRHITFASPLRLNLRILCTYGTPVRKSLDIWPTFPIVIGYNRHRNGFTPDFVPTDEDNVIAALEHTSRVCEVRLTVAGPQLGRVATMMQEPFPALTHLTLLSEDTNVPVLPGQFLGRSAPCLQELRLDGIPFPALPILLPSASDLVTLTLFNIPHIGYISPEAMVAGLATLPRLRTLSIGFRSPNSRPDEIHLPPTTRTVLPALTFFEFRGVREYLEDFAARIDTHLLNRMEIKYLNQLVDFEVPQLSRIIDHSEALKGPMDCSITFHPHRIIFSVTPSDTPESDDPQSDFYIDFSILCEGIDWQVSHLTRVLSQLSPVSSNTIVLTINSNLHPRTPKPEDSDIDDLEWLQLLSLFSSVQVLIVDMHYSGHVSRILEGVAGMTAIEVLPALDTLSLIGQSLPSVEKFIAARRDSGRPVATVNGKTESENINKR